jgi:sugar transferase EpsL
MAPYRGKRGFDPAIVLVTAPFWVPALAVVAGLVHLRLGSPVLFRQVRAGHGGRPFEMIKFRTMNEKRDEKGVLMPDSARLTRFSKWLRSTSLDELPELINVLHGEMSLVGPRPLLIQYLPLYSPRHLGRHEVPPGITGLAQVSGRNALNWFQKFELDVQYADSNSLLLDVRILWRTLLAVALRRGISTPGEATMPPFRGYEPEGPPPGTAA